MMIDFQHIAEHLATGGFTGSAAYFGLRGSVNVLRAEFKSFRLESNAWRDNTERQIQMLTDKMIPNR